MSLGKAENNGNGRSGEAERYKQAATDALEMLSGRQFHIKPLAAAAGRSRSGGHGRGWAAGYIARAPRSSGLADVLEILLDRGPVIDAYVRVSLLGIELLTVDLRVVIAGVDTYLRFAEAVNRPEREEYGSPPGSGGIGPDAHPGTPAGAAT